MGIKRNEVAEPKWYDWDYAKIDKENLFSNDLWKRTINWYLMLEQVKRTESACQLINEYIYPSRLFLAHIDLLEANMHILNDIFYYETGIPQKPANNNMWFIQATHYLRFWNMDWYKEMKMIYEGLYRIENHLINCLRQEPLSDIYDEVYKKSNYVKCFRATHQEPHKYDYNRHAYFYACKAYRDSEIDKNALADQIVNIVNIIEDYKAILYFFVNINESTFNIIDFDCLVTMFRQSGKGKSFIKPWRRDFEGSRDSLILKMEKDPKLGPWVNRCTHLREIYDEKTTVQLFCDDDYNVKNIEETFNTDNWIRLLTIAAILQEYDEQHAVSAPTATEPDKVDDEITTEPDKVDDEILLTKLSSFFISEDAAKKFLDAARTMSNKEIIALVKQKIKYKACTDSSKGLWKVLHDAGLYTAGYSNWNAQIPRIKEQNPRIKNNLY